MTAVQAATLWPWSSSCSLMGHFRAGVDDPMAPASILSGRGGRTHIGRVRPGAELVPVARDAFAARPGRRAGVPAATS